jgi:tetratricopeptide (TPR) repeat protein
MVSLKRIVERTAIIGSTLFFASLLFPQPLTKARAHITFLPTQLSLSSNYVAKGRQDIPVLERGKPIERELKGGDTHTYKIRLALGQCLHFIVDQRGIDVVVRIVGPDGALRGVYDSPTGAQGPESVWLLAEVSGDYQLEVHSFEKTAAGRYEARIEELRTATPQDKSRVAAQQAYAEGLQLSDPGKPESLHRALEKYETALALWRTSDDRAGEASTFFMIGAVHAALGEWEKALDFFQQNLRLERGAGNRSGEARALINIGEVYSQSGEMQKALDYDTQALPLTRAIGDRHMEALIFNHVGAVYESLGEKEKALKAYNQALVLWQAISDGRQEAQTLKRITKLQSNR